MTEVQGLFGNAYGPIHRHLRSEGDSDRCHRRGEGIL